MRVGRRRAPAAALVAVLAAVGVAGGAAMLIVDGNTGGGPLQEPGGAASLPSASTTAPAEPTCVPSPYQPCGEEPAPNTDGVACTDGHGDYDGDPTNGCEAVPDRNPDGMDLRGEVTGNIVPADDVDRFDLRLVDNFQIQCDGRATVTLTSPEGSIHRLTVMSAEGKELGTAISSSGTPGVVALREPNCFHDDTTTVTVEVSAEPGSTPSSDHYTLTASGSY